jgi:hypothetical protein
MTKQTTSGESTVAGTGAEEARCYQQSPAKYDECDCCLLNYYIAKSMKKVTGCVAINVLCGTTKYGLMRKARGSSFVVDAADQNCITK